MKTLISEMNDLREAIFLRLLGMAETDLSYRLTSIREHAEANDKEWAQKLQYDSGVSCPLNVIMESAKYVERMMYIDFYE